MTIDETLKQLAESQLVANGILVRLEQRVEGHEERIARLETTLVEFIEESRAGARRVEDAIGKVAAAQLVTEQKLQAFIDSLRRGGNGAG